MDNQQLDRASRIDRYLKGEMDIEEKKAFEHALDKDEELQHALEKTEIAIRAVQYEGLQKDVGDIRYRMLSEEEGPTLSGQQQPVKRPLPFGFYALRVAASLLLVLLAFAGIQMAVLDPQRIYQEKINFEVVDVVERSDEESSALSSILAAYQQDNFQDAAALYSTLAEPSIKEQYIAAAAYLQLNQYTEASEIYRQILDGGLQSTEMDYWEQRAAYNLAITGIQLGKYQEAITLLEKLKANEVYGSYYDQLVSDYALWKLRLLDFKASLLDQQN